MFTGLIEEIGSIKAINNNEIFVYCKKILEDAKIGDSISVNGLCLSITNIYSNYVSFHVSPTTKKHSRFKIGDIRVGEKVNLERALTPSTKLGGHIVLGHIDGRDEKIPHSHQLNKILEEHELVGWFELFHADVRHIFDNTGNWSSFDQFLILNRHLERLLWSFGIIPERNDSGGLYVHVPLSTDAERLLEENLQ